MKKKLSCILLVDDDDCCNFIHERLLKKMECTDLVVTAKDGSEGIEYLKSGQITPDLIFLDINMPKMDGWEFLDEYQTLSEDKKNKIIIIMLTSSLNPDDKLKAETYSCVNDYDNKYLDNENLNRILRKHFPDRF